MNQNPQTPVIVHPKRYSIEDILQYVDPDPLPDGEIERFVALIYADRRAAAAAG